MRTHHKGFLRTWLFGGILPWFGWETVPVDADGEPAESGPFEADFLTLEWFGTGLTLYMGECRPARS